MKFTLWFLIIAALVGSRTINAQPVNDACVDAIVLNPMSNVTINGDTTGTVPTTISSEGTFPFEGLFYKLTTSTMILSITSTICSSDLSNMAEIFVLNGNDCATYRVVNRFDGTGCVPIEFIMKANESYWLFISLYMGNFEYVDGTFDFSLTFRIATPPPNDECTEAIPFNPFTDTPVVVIGNTTDSVSGQVFYTTQTSMDFDAIFTATICRDSVGDASLGVLRQTGNNCALSDRESSFISFNPCESFTFTAVKNATYYLQVDVPGAFNITISAINKPPNDECSTALVVDPFDNDGSIISGNTAGSDTGYLVYRVTTGPERDVVPISSTICKGNGNNQAETLVYKSNDDNCGDIVLVAQLLSTFGTCFVVPFDAMKNSLYFIIVGIRDGNGNIVSGNFTIDITGPALIVPTMTPSNSPSMSPLISPSNVPSLIPQEDDCGLFGFNFFCPLPGRCGFLRRLFNLGSCD